MISSGNPVSFNLNRPEARLSSQKCICQNNFEINSWTLRSEFVGQEFHYPGIYAGVDELEKPRGENDSPEGKPPSSDWLTVTCKRIFLFSVFIHPSLSRFTRLIASSAVSRVPSACSNVTIYSVLFSHFHGCGETRGETARSGERLRRSQEPI